VLHGNFGQETLKSASLIGRATALALIVVDDYDAIPRPPQSDRVLGQSILAFPRFPIVEDLLGVGLPNVNDDDAVEVKVQDLGRSKNARSAEARRSWPLR
jgi:hypothetical protein